MQRKIYDAIIVGAGPAGATVSRKLAEKGMDVLILEKGRLPRDKPCGGGVTVQARNLLLEDGIDPSAVIEDTIQQIEITFGDWCLLKGCTQLYTVLRRDFDHFLVKASVNSNAKLIDGQKVTAIQQKTDHVIVTAGEDFYSRVAIGADGANSTVAKLAEIPTRKRTAFGIVSKVYPKNLAGETGDVSAWRGRILLDLGAVPNGYGWVFPKKDHLSVGIYTRSHRAIKNMRRHLDDFLVRMRFQVNGETQIQGGGVSLSRKGVFHRGRILLVGDAAGLVTPMAGEGIRYAILSGQTAADVVGRFLTAQISDLSPYTHRVNEDIIENLRLSRLPIELFGAMLAARNALANLIGLYAK